MRNAISTLSRDLLATILKLGCWFSFAVPVAGQVFVWGSNSGGQTNVPAMSTNVIALAGGDDHCIALLADRTVLAWGENSRGQTDVPADLTNIFGIGAGSTHSLAVQSNGIVRQWGEVINSSSTKVPPEATNAVAVAMGPGAQHAVALRADGTVVEWGIVGEYTAVLTNIPASVINVVSVAAGAFHSVALRSDGRVVAWGDNSYGQLNVPVSATNIVSIAAGWYHSAALRADGKILTWGSLSFYSGTLAPPPTATNIIELICGGFHTMALRRDGRVITWGNNDWGQLSVPAAATNIAMLGGNSRGSMAAVGEGPPIFPYPAIRRTIASSETAYLRLTAAGAPPISYRWSFNGSNLPGATNAVLALTNALPEQSGIYALTASNAFGVVTNADMTLRVWPVLITNQPQSQMAYLGGTVTFSAASGGQTPLYYQWLFNGTNIAGATNGILGLTNVQYSGSGEYSVVISNTLGTAVSSVARLNVVPIVVARKPEDQVVFRGGAVSFDIESISSEPVSYQWQFNGTNLPGAIGSSLTLTNVGYAQSGGYSVMVSNSLGTTNTSGTLSVVAIAAWGQSDYGQTTIPAELTNVIALAVGSRHSLALNADGSLSAWGDNSFGQTNLLHFMTNAVGIGAGSLYSLVLNADDTVTAWGYNTSGQTNVPSGLTNVVMVDGGSAFNLALNADGTVVAWGSNSSGQTNVPQSLSNVVAIAAGSSHSLALRSDGSVIAWGSNSSGQTNVPSGLTNIVAVSAGSSHSMALRADGTLSVWGSSSSGLQNIPLAATNVVAIGAGSLCCFALKADGGVIAWGTPLDGRTNVPSSLTNVVAIAASFDHVLALVGEGPPLQSAFFTNPTWLGNSFSVSIATQSGRVYRLEYKNSLNDSDWVALPLVAGTGGLVTLRDPTVSHGPQKFYRVRRW